MLREHEAMKLHNYFSEFEATAKASLDADKTTRDLLLCPLVDSKDLFNRSDAIEDRNKLVYVFLDGSDAIRPKKINEDWTCNMPVIYVGMGEIARPLDHWKSAVNYNKRLREILVSRKMKHEDIYLMIYSCNMNDTEAKELEADLICQVDYIQSPITGMSIYKKSRTPVRSVNKKGETSNQRVYSTNGIKQKR